jgi:DNA-binding NtrC family response regulator
MIDPATHPPLPSHQIGVLLVEDDAVLAMDMAEKLESFGQIVFEARNAQRAIRVLEAREDVRVMITDVDFTSGQMSGLDLAQLVARRWPRVGIVITSGHATPTASDLPPGARFFPKPYREYQLRGAVYAIIEQQDEARG